MFGHATYLLCLLVWALPVLGLHWLVGGALLRRHRGVLLLGSLVPTLYLCSADSVALHLGIWTLHPDRILGLYLGNVPLEECLFFLATNLIVVQTVILLLLLTPHAARQP